MFDDLHKYIARCQGKHLKLNITSYCQFSLPLSYVSIPKSYQQALAHPGWQVAMEEEVNTLISHRSWELNVFPDKEAVGCYVFIIKYLVDGTIEHLKA